MAAVTSDEEALADTDMTDVEAPQGAREQILGTLMDKESYYQSPQTSEAATTASMSGPGKPKAAQSRPEPGIMDIGFTIGTESSSSPCATPSGTATLTSNTGTHDGDSTTATTTRLTERECVTASDEDMSMWGGAHIPGVEW